MSGLSGIRARAKLALAACAALAIMHPALPRDARAEDVLIFAAASMKTALDDIAAGFHAETGDRALVSYAASSTLAKQIENRAPADIYISADLEWMDYLQARNLIEPATRSNLAGNRLVLIAPAASAITVKIAPNFALASLLGDRLLAMADPDHVPAGRYARAALEHLNVWTALERRIARAENVRTALILVSRGETPLGIVYRTDAVAHANVRIVDTFPANTHPPIVYPVAQVATSAKPAAGRFLSYLKSPAAEARLRQFGFTPPPR